MLHLIAEPASTPRPQPYAEAVARLAGVRHALRLVDPHGGGPAPDLDDDVAARGDEAGEARRRGFDTRSAQAVSAAADGVEALLETRKTGREPNAEASRALAEQIRRELAEIARIVVD